jgi:hypothetical protein
MSQFSCGKYSYRAGAIDARSQFHIVRRMTPFLNGLVPLLSGLKTIDEVKGIDQGAALKAMPAFTEILAEMDDDTADYVIFGLLSTVTRDQGKGLGWAPVSNGKSLMFNDISMPEMLTLAGRSLAANLGDFFGVLNSALNLVGQKQNDQ